MYLKIVVAQHSEAAGNRCRKKKNNLFSTATTTDFRASVADSAIISNIKCHLQQNEPTISVLGLLPFLWRFCCKRKPNL
jgi:hypothetical protein